jgi:hypothetical protein
VIHSNPRYLSFPLHNSHAKVISKRVLPSVKNFVSGEIFLSIILSVSLLGTVILLVTVGNFISQRAYGDGLTAENLPPATVGDRQASLFVKISPPILTTESKGNAFLQFRLYDERNNQTIKFVTYEIAIRKANAPTDSRPLLRDFFQAPNGLLTIKVEPTESGPVQLFGDRDPFLSALIADPGGTVNVRGPILTDGGLYHIEVRIFGIDNVRNIFKPENAPKFDSYLSIGDITYHNLTYNDRTYNSTLISYYDEIESFDYDPQAQNISWSMPFDWNTTRIQEQNIFVHEEIKLPNAFLEAINASSSPATFTAMVNDQPLVGRALAIDPFTANDTIIIHYLINKNQILDLANNLTTKNEFNNATATDSNTSTVAVNDNKSISVGNTRGTPDSRINYMQFSLMPITGNTTQSTSSDLTTDTGGIHATVTWEPKQLKAIRQSTVHINFSDAFSGEPLLANVLYNMSILDSNGTEVLRMDNLTAINATDSRVVSFPADAIYQIEVNVKGIIREDQGSPDTTRSGIARGYVVVPEFSSPSSSLVVAGVIISALIFVARYHRGKRKYLSNE